MKQKIAFLCSLCMVFSLVSCSNSDSNRTESVTSESMLNTEPSVTIETEEPVDDVIVSSISSEESIIETTNTDDGLNSLDAFGDVEVDKGLMFVTLDIPADFVGEGTTQEECDSIAKEKGFKSITLNEDGSAKYVMTKAKHVELMESISSSLDEQIQAMIDSGEYPNIKAITHNDDYSEFKITYSGEDISLGDSLTVLVFYGYCGMYNVFDGNQIDNCNVKFVSESSGELIKEANSKDVG